MANHASISTTINDQIGVMTTNPTNKNAGTTESEAPQDASIAVSKTATVKATTHEILKHPLFATTATVLILFIGFTFTSLTTNIGRLDNRVDRVEDGIERLEIRIDQRFDRVDDKFDGVNRQFNEIDRRFDAVERQFNDVDRRINTLDQKVDAVDQKVDALDQKVDALDRTMNEIRLTLTTLVTALSASESVEAVFESTLLTPEPETEPVP